MIIFLKITKWMLPYVGSIKPPLHLTYLLNTLLLNTGEALYFHEFFYISFFSIENKCLSNLICDGKTEKNKFGIKWIQTQVDQIK